MKKELCMMAIGLLLASCSADEEIANVQTSEANAISFNVVSNNPQTKAELIDNATDLQKYPFDIFAFKEDGTLFMGAHDTEYAHDGVEIRYQSGMWTYTDQAEKKYWPHEPLHFYAVYPVLSDNRFMFMSWLMNRENHSISYTAFDEFAEGNTAKNVDVMYAIAPYQKKSKNRGTVALTFKHALSQLLFKAVTEDLTIEVKIKEMSIHNIYFSGCFQLPSFDESGKIAEANNTLWTSISPTKGAFSIGMNGSPITVNHSEIEISNGENAMLVIPQKLIPWDLSTAGGISVANSNKQSYLQIKCKIQQGKQYFVGGSGDDNYGDIYVPFKADWQPGKRYIYTLKFGGGYTEDGKEIDLMPITFSASVENWDDASGDEIKHPDL